MDVMKRKNIRNASELEITHTKGSGPGGQNRNKRLSGVRVVHVPTGLSVVATERRSQNQNKEAALDRLDQKLSRLYFKPKRRVKTAPSRSAKVKRARGKEVVSLKKKLRKPPGNSDW